MNAIEQTYIGLLADVADISGFSEIRGSELPLQWCIYDAPKLEKRILDCVEHGLIPVLDDCPGSLKRLALGAITDPMLMRALRQLLLFCYKATVPYDKEQTKKAYQGFLDTNVSVGNFGNSLSRQSPSLLNTVRQHTQSVIYKFRPKSIRPGHGPGAVTTCKQVWQHMYSSIEYLYPYSDWYYLYYNRDSCSHYDALERPEHIEAKLTAVPKDSRGPRLICVHPAEAIWIQQGLRVELERAVSLDRYPNKGPWPRGRIAWTDQSVNGRISLTSSRSRRYATIDMKEASDRIAEPLVQILFGDKYKYFAACRAQKVRLPPDHLGDSVVDIHSYAPMGNATTFPVQSVVFWAICVAEMQRVGYHSPGAAFVFGDDIIVPTECVEGIIDALHSFGLLVNKEKSFWRGPFRESCGVDAFNGVNVTPVRWKTTLNADTVADLQSLSDIAMRLRLAGYENAAATAYSILRERLKRHQRGARLFYTNNPHHGGIAEFTRRDASAWSDSYWSPNLHWYHTPVWRLKHREPPRASYGWNRVFESLCSLERNGRSSVSSTSVPRRFKLKRGWTIVK